MTDRRTWVLTRTRHYLAPHILALAGCVAWFGEKSDNGGWWTSALLAVASLWFVLVANRDPVETLDRHMLDTLAQEDQ